MGAEEQAMLVKVRCLASDGGPTERKLMYNLVRSICPGVALLIRDFAHAARIAMQKPQQFDPVFDALQTYLVNNDDVQVEIARFFGTPVRPSGAKWIASCIIVQ